MKLSFPFTFALFALGLNNAYAAPNHEPTAAEKQISARQQQQQTALDSAIQSQQVQDPSVRLESEKVQSVGFPVNEAQCFPINQLVLTDYNANEANPKLIQPSQFHWALSAVYAERRFCSARLYWFGRD